MHLWDFLEKYVFNIIILLEDIVDLNDCFFLFSSVCTKNKGNVKY